MKYNRKKQSKNIIDDWADIRRYSNPEKGLSEKSCKILSSVRYLIKKYGEAILTHEEIAKITRRKSDQNSNLVKELGFVQDIEFHRVLVRDDKKYNNAYIFTDNENTDEILENPEEYFADLFAENSGQEPKKFGARAEKIRGKSEPLYIYTKKDKKRIDNHDNQHNQFLNSKNFSNECVETEEAKITTSEIVENSENRLAEEECQDTSQVKIQESEFIETPIASDYFLGDTTENIKNEKRTATPPISTKTVETVGKDGNTYQSPYLRDFRFTDRMIQTAIFRSNKKHYKSERVWVIIRNILEKKPDKTVYGGKQGAINYLVKAIDGEKDYEYEYKYPPSKEEQAISMAEISNMKRIQLEKELVKNEIKWF